MRRNRRTLSELDGPTRQVEITDSKGQSYTAIDRVKGVIVCEPVLIHRGLYGFIGPAMVPPTVQLVARRQVIRKEES